MSDVKMGKEHDQTLELLPWFVNETLAGKDLELVLRHLSDCRDCRLERDRLQQLRFLVREDDREQPDHRLSLRRVMQRIETSERNRDSTRDFDATGARRRFLPLGIAASVVSLMLAGAAWLSLDGSTTAQQYQTLSSDALNAGTAYRMELGFVNPIPAATLRQALIETNSNIVSGPDANGHYLVEIVVPGNMKPVDYLSQIKMIKGVQSARFIQAHGE